MSQQTETISPFSESVPIVNRSAARPTARQWALHALLFVATALTTTISGIIWVGAPEFDNASSAPATGGGPSSLFLLPWYYLSGIISLAWQALTHPALLAPGVKFSVSLLAILTAHESGHYLFCRYYGVDATLPFFIPQPPGLLPGTFGAFIRMKSPVPSRRALFDIGLAGPLAGFILIVPVAFAAILTLHHVPLYVGQTSSSGGVITFNDPLLFRLIARCFKVDFDNS